ncbi:Tether containing UBX domain for GLUT4 isoform 1 [Schistosoma japonicum]|uniref:Tether containing UBX domain for GLUT4 isoform 1 n=1 Tax=Schistosoma japonicum TaxID=6182 RepID=A0A4Z2DJW7_SCHJA|nr:Tether containing UBX domain for GLUT4 isoform 1 [Schistosoma japonicum]
MPYLNIRYPAGHIVTIKISKSAALVQVLKRACEIENLEFSKCSLSHNHCPIDLFQSFSLSGLANHSDLELMHSSDSDGNQSTVRICFRLDNGQRLEWSGCSDSPIWSILECLASNNSSVADMLSSEHNSSSGDGCPAVIYFQNKVIGESNLRAITLANLGIHRSSALLQLTIVPRTSESMSCKIDTACEGTEHITALNIPMSHETNRETCETDDITVSEYQKTVKPSSSYSNEPLLETLSNNNDSAHSSNIPSQTWTDESTVSGFVSPFSVFADRPSISAFENVGQFGSTHRQTEQNQQPRTLGEILGVSLQTSSQFHVNNAQLSTYPFSEFKFPVNTEGQNLNAKISSSVCEISTDDSFDRELVIFRRPSNMSSKRPVGDDLPDEFFEHTEEDIRKLLRFYHNEWTENKPFQTSAMRSEARHQYYTKYSRAVVQFHWVDNFVIQACFMPNEKVSALYQFIRDLHRFDCDFELYTTPPKLFLSDKTITLIEADLVPLSRVFYHPSETLAENVLRSDVLDKATTKENINRAQSIVAYWMKNSSSHDANENSTSGGDSHVQKNLKHSDSHASNSSSLPKWLKLRK